MSNATMGNTKSDTIRMSEKKAEKTGLTAVATELTGKCSYPACKHDEEEKTTQFLTVKNTDYQFHSDCYGFWSQENRGMGRFQIDEKIAALDEQTGKSKEAKATEAKK